MVVPVAEEDFIIIQVLHQVLVLEQDLLDKVMMVALEVVVLMLVTAEAAEAALEQPDQIIQLHMVVLVNLVQFQVQP